MIHIEPTTKYCNVPRWQAFLAFHFQVWWHIGGAWHS